MQVLQLLNMNTKSMVPILDPRSFEICLKINNLGKLYAYYFSNNLVYDGRLFRMQNKMNIILFLRIMDTFVPMMCTFPKEMLSMCKVCSTFKSALQH
jgi:hypothetical protein